MSKTYELKDKKGRVVLYQNKKGKLALSRFPDLGEEEIKHLAEIYSEISGDDIKKTEDFLRFEDQDEKFCS